MSYNPVSEKVPVVPMQTSRPVSNNDYRQNGDIRRARRIVLILLAVELVSTIVALTVDRVFSLGSRPSPCSISSNESSLWLVITTFL